MSVILSLPPSFFFVVEHPVAAQRVKSVSLEHSSLYSGRFPGSPVGGACGLNQVSEVIEEFDLNHGALRQVCEMLGTSFLTWVTDSCQLTELPEELGHAAAAHR